MHIPGTLEFVDLENYITHHIPPGNDTFRSVSTSDRGGFKFGDKVIDRVFVCCLYLHVHACSSLIWKDFLVKGDHTHDCNKYI